jgi:hypothetical protein
MSCASTLERRRRGNGRRGKRSGSVCTRRHTLRCSGCAAWPDGPAETRTRGGPGRGFLRERPVASRSSSPAADLTHERSARSNQQGSYVQSLGTSESQSMVTVLENRDSLNNQRLMCGSEWPIRGFWASSGDGREPADTAHPPPRNSGSSKGGGGGGGRSVLASPSKFAQRYPCVRARVQQSGVIDAGRS